MTNLDVLSRSPERSAEDVPETANFSDGWAGRAAVWHADGIGCGKCPKVPAAQRQPLILSGHGIHLRINHGSLEIRDGFTHYPQQRETFRFFPGDRERPSRIIVLDGKGAVTLDVISWLAVQDIPLVQLDYRGNVVAAIGSSGIGHDPALVALQLAATETPKKACAVSTWLIREKLIATRQTALDCLPDGELRDTAIARLDRDIERLTVPWAGSKEALLGIEGKCAQVYFDAWRSIPLSWKGTGRKPIPEAWHSIGTRRAYQKRGNRFASHPVQAMLNYAYAVMESHIRIEVAKVGLDMSIGFLHKSQHDRPALALDLIEPARPAVDRAVLGFVRGHTFAPADFTLNNDGVVRLHPQLARRIVAEVSQIDPTKPLIAGLLDRIGHKTALAIPHRSKAWLAQRGLQLRQTKSAQQ